MLKKVEWIALLALIVFAICGTRVSGATYFVAKSGNDQNSCQSADEACLTIARASQLATQPGDVVQVGPGEYLERVTIAVGGDATSPITYTGATDSGCPTVENADPNSRGQRPAPAATTLGFTVGASHVVVDCFRMVASGIDGERGAGVYIERQVLRVTVTNNFVDGSLSPGRPWAGVAMKSAIAPSEFAGEVTASRNYIRNTAHGFMIFCLRNCLFEENEVEQLKASELRGDNDYSRIFGEHITMRGNYFHGNRIEDCNGCHMDCFQSYNVGGIDHIARHITIDANTCFAAHQMVIIRDTSSKDPEQFVSHYDWKITNNVFGFGPEGSKSTWCGLFDHVGELTFEHNLCAVTGVAAYLNGSRGTHNYNIHFESGWVAYTGKLNGWGEGTVTGRGNLLFRSNGTFQVAQWPNDTVNRKPVFLDASAQDFRIHPSSPARNAAPSSAQERDRLGTERPKQNTSDIGPYEFSPNAEPNP